MSGIDPVHHFFNAAVAPGITEQPLLFECEGAQLLGILAQGARAHDCGVLIIVGGPQYRVGSHRQFVLLARRLAAAGYTSLRFDYRGMGDSDGGKRDFLEVEKDLAAAVQAFREAAPHVQRIVLLGLCDAASAALMYGTTLPGVAGLVLLNPWVRSEVTLARAQVKHYYGARLTDAAFWRKLLAGDVDVRGATSAFCRRLGLSFATGRQDSPAGFQQRMAQGLRNFHGPVLLMLSGKDLTAQEFRDYVAHDARWRKALAAAQITRFDAPEADHTFSRAAWRESMQIALLDWLHTHYVRNAQAEHAA